MANELRWSVRRLMRTPAATIAALAVFSLGIGSTVTIYTVDRAVLLNRLPLSSPEQVVVVQRRVGDGNVSSMHSPADLIDFRRHRELFSSVSAAAGFRALLSGTAEPTYVNGSSVTPDYFQTIGASPLLGHVFRASGERLDVAVLSWHLWQSQFGGDSTILERTIQLNRESYHIVGVMPQRLGFLQSDLWVPGPQGIPKPPPVALGPELLVSRDIAYIDIIGRLHQGISSQRATTVMEAISRSIARKYPAGAGEVRFFITPLKSVVAGDAKSQLLFLSIGAALVFVLVCLSVAGLLVGRAMGRAHEDSVKLALGATRAQVLASGIADALVLAGTGGIFGTLASVWGVRLLLSIAPPMERSMEASLNVPVLVFAIGAVIVASLLASVLPALRTLRLCRKRIDVGNGRRSQSREHNLAWASLVTLQIGLMAVLLVGSVTSSRNFLQLRAVDLGFKPNGVLAGAIVLPAERYQDPAMINGFFESAVSRLSEQPGIGAAGVASSVPLIPGRRETSFSILGSGERNGAVSAGGWFSVVGARYFGVMDMRMLAGREFVDDDRYGAPMVAIVNRAMARRYWPNASPLGARLQFASGDQATVVGVVSDVRHSVLESEVEPRIYRPYAQAPSRAMYLVVRSSADDAQAGAAARRAIEQIDPAQPLPTMSPLDLNVRDALRPTRYIAVVLGGFSCTAVLISALGLYGLLRFRAYQEEYEVAIRIALGAPTASLIRRRLVRGLLIAACGITLGGVLVFVAARLVEHSFPAMPYLDTAVLVLAACVSALVSVLASMVPAFRVLAVDPSVISRSG